jgi:hypothetical protein
VPKHHIFKFDPSLTDEEVHAAALQLVRKISGFHKPSKTNEATEHAREAHAAARKPK